MKSLLFQPMKKEEPNLRTQMIDGPKSIPKRMLMCEWERIFVVLSSGFTAYVTLIRHFEMKRNLRIQSFQPLSKNSGSNFLKLIWLLCTRGLETFCEKHLVVSKERACCIIKPFTVYIEIWNMKTFSETYICYSVSYAMYDVIIL